MAQNREKEETELKVPEAPSLCSPPIPKHPLKLSGNEDQSFSSARLPESSDLPKSSDFGDLRFSSARAQQSSDLRSAEGDGANKLKRKWVNRCSGCKRKVGLMGFQCRCGDMFCSEHRYSDRHDCSFDYKAAGREAIARENPVVRAAKILKI